MSSVSLAQAASMTVGRRNSIYVPGCYKPHLAAIRRTYWQEEEILDFEEHRISKLICWRQVLYMGLLPAIGMTLLRYMEEGWTSIVWLLWIPTVYFLSLRYYRNWRYFVSEEGIRTQSGLFTMKHTLLQWYKIQAVDIRQSIYQRRKEVAHLTLYTAAGSVRIPYIELDKARAIHDFVMYKVESDGRRWM
jgi:putative membrane protein